MSLKICCNYTNILFHRPLIRLIKCNNAVYLTLEPCPRLGGPALATYVSCYAAHYYLNIIFTQSAAALIEVFSLLMQCFFKSTVCSGDAVMKKKNSLKNNILNKTYYFIPQDTVIKNINNTLGLKSHCHCSWYHFLK